MFVFYFGVKTEAFIDLKLYSMFFFNKSMYLVIIVSYIKAVCAYSCGVECSASSAFGTLFVTDVKYESAKKLISSFAWHEFTMLVYSCQTVSALLNMLVLYSSDEYLYGFGMLFRNLSSSTAGVPLNGK